MNGASLALLAAAGFIPAAFGRVQPLLVGAATIALLPLISVAEMLVDPRSHNLWPIEFVVYGVVAIPGVMGAYLGRWFRHSVWGTAPAADERP